MSVIVRKFVYIITPESIEAICRGDIQRNKIGAINGDEMGFPHYCINVDDSSEAGAIVIEVWFNNPHARIVVRSIVNLRKPLYQSTRVPFPSKIKAYEEPYPRCMQTLHSWELGILLN